MFLIDRDTEIEVRRGYMSGGLSGAAKALRSRFMGLDDAAATKCAERILSWRLPDETSLPRPTRAETQGKRVSSIQKAAAKGNEPLKARVRRRTETT